MLNFVCVLCVIVRTWNDKLNYFWWRLAIGIFWIWLSFREGSCFRSNRRTVNHVKINSKRIQRLKCCSRWSTSFILNFSCVCLPFTSWWYVLGILEGIIIIKSNRTSLSLQPILDQIYYWDCEHAFCFNVDDVNNYYQIGWYSIFIIFEM